MATTSSTRADSHETVPVAQQVHGGTHDKAGRHHRMGGQKFQFGPWIRLHGVDIITMACLGAIALGIYQAGEDNNVL